MPAEGVPVLVLGVGNILWADEGFGVRCVEALQQDHVFPEGVRLLDGGTQGLYLVPDICAAQKLLLLDAVDFGATPGTLVVLRNDDVPRFTGAKKMSMHQTGMQDVLSAAQLLDRLPQEVVLVGVQPEDMVDFGGGLTPTMSRCVALATAAAVEQLTAWGFAPSPRTTPLPPSPRAALERQHYEGGRPSNEEACRQGDARFFPRAQE